MNIYDDNIINLPFLGILMPDLAPTMSTIPTIPIATATVVMERDMIMASARFHKQMESSRHFATRPLRSNNYILVHKKNGTILYRMLNRIIALA